MGRKSVIENKNIYHTSRENLKLSRDKASELLGVSSDRIEKIENGTVNAYPEEVLAMGEGYKNPLLYNYYCSHDCPLGQKVTPAIEVKDISQIALEMIVAINSIDKQKDRLAEIIVDGKVSQDESKDFETIKGELNRLSMIIDSLNLWVEQTEVEGKTDK